MGFRLRHGLFSPKLHAMSEAANTVPVTILTGFLGSGKTTVLNHLLRQPSLADTVVIVNEFGAVGLDHLLIEQATQDAEIRYDACGCRPAARSRGGSCRPRACRLGSDGKPAAADRPYGHRDGRSPI